MKKMPYANNVSPDNRVQVYSLLAVVKIKLFTSENFKLVELRLFQRPRYRVPFTLEH